MFQIHYFMSKFSNLINSGFYFYLLFEKKIHNNPFLHFVQNFNHNKTFLFLPKKKDLEILTAFENEEIIPETIYLDGKRITNLLSLELFYIKNFTNIL
jgi:hypothetical protein